MKILQIHNFYQQPGGEDQVFNTESELLKQKGNTICQYTLTNDAIENLSKSNLFLKTHWNQESYHDLEKIIQAKLPDICHFHNTFPLISPSAYYACKKNNVPVVQTLHNYRLICPNALLFRDGGVCEDCAGRFFPWPGILHACYRNSRSTTGVVALMLSLHRLLGTWQKQVDVFIALTEFGKRKFISGGLPEDKIVVSPNIVDPDPGKKEVLGDFALFVGRLSYEKGLETLIQSWEHLPSIPLLIVGDGPLREALQKAIANQALTHIKLLGRMSHEDTLALMKQARVLIFPSECYETFGITIVEALACGLPVIASNLGAMNELIQDGHTGMLFEPGNPQDLVQKVSSCWSDQEKLKQMGAAARVEYEQKYTQERKYQSLMSIYEKAIRNRQNR